MVKPLFISILITLFASLIFQRLAIRAGFKWKLLDIPSSRRRHSQPTPIIGGLGVIAAWFLGLAVYIFQQPEWLSEISISLYVISAGVISLMILGIVDDLHGLSPKTKLLVETLVATSVLLYEPSVNQIMIHWQDHMGPIVWLLGLIWIVGITNSINLIDGLDGLAGGTSLLVASSILILSIWTGSEAQFGIVAISLLIPALVAFLRVNWHPAKIFLGDNGSLSLGFLLGSLSLACRPQSKSWVMIASIILMLGYPILDMGLCVLRRRKNHFPMFKADRNHLHFRVLRVGLTVRQTAVLLLSISLFLQVAALSINLLSPPAASLGISVVCFSIFTLLFVIWSIEGWKVRTLANRLQKSRNKTSNAADENLYTVMKVDLVPLFEVGVFEEEERCQKILSSLELMIRSTLKRTDHLLVSKNDYAIILTDVHFDDVAALDSIRHRFSQRMAMFLDLYQIQMSLAGLPITFEQRHLILNGDTVSERPNLKIAG